VTRRLARGELIAIALLACAHQARAQVVDRTKRPVVPAAPTFKFPDVQTHTLRNGLRLVVVEDHSVALVAARVVFAVDSTADPKGKEGLYAVTIGGLREGTTSKNVDQLAEAFADIGSTVTPSGFTTTTAGFERALALAGEMLMHSTLDDAGIERRKALQAANVRRLWQATVTVPRHLFYAKLYGADDPFVRSLVPTEASVASVTRDDVARFYAEHFQPQTTTVIIVGDITAAAATAVTRRVFGRWARGGATTEAVAASSNSSPQTTIFLHDVPGSQAFLYVGALGPTRTSGDFYALETMGAISGTRMQQTLRDRRSIMYSGNSAMVWRRAPQSSALVGSTTVNATKVDSALTEWLSLLRGLRGAQPISPHELDGARRSRVGTLAARIDGADSLAARLVELVRDDAPLDFFDRYAMQMAKVTANGVVSAASRYIDMDHLIVVVTGDRSVIEPALRAANIAPVVIVDANGGPIDR
jgi:zinc protease